MPQSACRRDSGQLSPSETQLWTVPGFRADKPLPLQLKRNTAGQVTKQVFRSVSLPDLFVIEGTPYSLGDGGMP
jgi:hypothetical protein